MHCMIGIYAFNGRPIKKAHREGENTEVKADNITEVPKAQRATEL